MNRSKSRVLSLVLVCTLILGLIPANLSFAAASYTLSKGYVSPSKLPSNITVTADVSTFTAGEVYPSAVDSLGAGTALSVVSSTDKTVIFKLPSGLAKDTYEIRIGDPSAPSGYYTVGDIIVEDPSITAVAPLINQPFGYDTITDLTITGQYVNFQTGQTVVEVLSSNTVVQSPTITSITDNTTTRDITFSLETGLGAGSYDVRVTTGDEVLTLAGAIIVRNVASVSLSSALNINEGYSQVTVDVDGTNTGFSEQSIVTITNEAGDDMSAVTGVNVASTTNLSFTLLSGLAPGNYTITIKTGVETANIVFTVGTPSAVIIDENTNVITSLGRSSDTVKVKVIGTNTDFTTGTSNVNLLDGGDNPVAGKISNVTVESTTQIDLTLDQNLTPGDYKIQVITNSQTVETGTFTVTEPSITSITYNSIVYNTGKLGEGYPAFQVTVVGDANSSFGSSSSVEVVGQSKISSISSADAQHLTFNIDGGLIAGNYQIQVDMDGDSGTTFDRFTVNEVPEFAFTVTFPSLDSVNPNAIVNTVSSNKSITVTGVNTHFAIDGARTTVAIKNGSGQIVGEVNNITAIDNDTLSFDLLPTSISNEGSYLVQVTVTKGSYTETISLSDALSVTASGISDIAPSYVYEDDLASGKTLAITGANTSFDSNDVVKIKENVITGVTIIDTTHMTVDIPVNLTAGSHTISIIDGASIYTSSFEIREARTMTLGGYEVPIDYEAEIVTLTTSNINFNNNTPVVTLIHPSGSREVVTGTVKNQDTLTFILPTGLVRGVYTVELSFTSGEHSNIALTDIFNITNRYNSLYFKVDNSITNSVTVSEGSSDVTLAVFGTLISGGNDEDVSSNAEITIADKNVAALSGNTLSFIGDGTTTITANYDDQTTELNVTVNSVGANIPPSGGGGFTPPPAGDGFIPPPIEDENKALDEKELIAIKKQLEAGKIGTKEAADKINGVANSLKDSLRNDEITVEDGLQAVKDIITWNADNLIKKDLKGKDTREVKDNILALTESLVEKSGSIETNYKIIYSNLIKDVLAAAKETSKEIKAELKANGLTDLESNIKERIVVKAKNLEDVVVSKATIKELAQNDFDLKVETSDVSFVLGTSNAIEDNINIIAKEVEDAEEYTLNKAEYQSQVGKVYDLNVTGNEGNVEVHLPVPQEQEDNEKLAVYVYDEVMNEWSFIHSKIVDGKLIFKAPHFSIYTIMENSISFEDVGMNLDVDLDIEGAKESIEVLAAKQVINGIGNNKFNPNGLVTRAEFAKMIIKAIGYDEAADNVFTDVPNDAWYTDYVAKAKHTGIVNGIGNGEFEPLSNITRQQVITMIARAYKYVKGSDLVGDDVTFVDKQDIKSWAIEAVNGTHYQGILPWSDNTLNPTINATRAESAVMIKRLLDIIE